MKKRFLICLAALLCTALLMSAAGADSITLSGKTVPAETVRVYAPVTGTAAGVPVTEGQKIQAGDTLYTLKTTRVYAESDGTVAGIFGLPGDDAETVGTRYGAVMYIEGTTRFTVSASTESAYTSAETKYIHTGEKVWMVCRSNASRYGTGTVTAVSGTSYTVEVTEGNFMSGDSVDIYRDADYTYELKIGRGSVSRTSPTAVTAAGGIAKIAVEDGAEVKRGDLLLELVDGTFDAYAMPGTDVTVEIGGVIGSIGIQTGETAEKGAAVAEIYPLDRMRVEADIPEDYCGLVKEGDQVTVELETAGNKTFTGTIVMISSVANTNEESGEVTYRMIAEFVPDETVRFGMSVLLTAGEEEKPEEEEKEPEEEETEQPEEQAEEQESEKKERRERPEGSEGRPEWSGEGERPEMPDGGSWGGRSSESTDASEETAEEGTAEQPAETEEN